MSRRPAPVAILATIAAMLSICVATTAPTAAEPYNAPISTSRPTLNTGFADARFHHAAWHRAGSHAQITNPNKIFAGQVLNIPKSHKTYVIQRGDTLSGISKKFGISLAALEAANRAGWHHAGWHHAT